MNRPIFVDFNGWAAVSSRKSEEQKTYTPANCQILRRHFVVARLMVDDRSPVHPYYLEKIDSSFKTIETMGDFWMNMQITRYKEVTQPMYVILNHSENSLVGKANYQSHGNERAMKKWMLEGLQAFQQNE